MSHQIVSAVAAVADRVVDLSRNDAMLRAELRTLAEAILDAIDSPIQEPEVKQANEGSLETLSICGGAAEVSPNRGPIHTNAQPAVTSAMKALVQPISQVGTSQPTRMFDIPSVTDATCNRSKIVAV